MIKLTVADTHRHRTDKWQTHADGHRTDQWQTHTDTGQTNGGHTQMDTGQTNGKTDGQTNS